VEGSRGTFLHHREKHKYRPYETKNIFKYNSARCCTYHFKFNTAERGGKGIGKDKQHLNTHRARQTVSQCVPGVLRGRPSVARQQNDNLRHTCWYMFVQRENEVEE